MDLLAQRCTHLPEGTPALAGEALTPFFQAVDSRWRLDDTRQLVADFAFTNFAEALNFTNQVGQLAEEQDHHPEITLTWGRVTVRIWTHTVGGVSPNDFILAAHIDALIHA
jgi:4a-hydroxytetrahydrobiopterin dehydratase